MRLLTHRSVFQVAIALLLLWCNCLRAEAPRVPSLKLELESKSFREARGVLRIAFFSSLDQMKAQRPAAHKNIAVNKSAATMSVSMDHPGEGVYVVAVYHDLNENDELDLGLFGMPSEPYGFSNNARAVIGLPSFEAAAISLESAESGAQPTYYIRLH